MGFKKKKKLALRPELQLLSLSQSTDQIILMPATLLVLLLSKTCSQRLQISITLQIRVCHSITHTLS